MADQKIRTRFAPSPTGYVHVGSLRTALFSHLFAKHSGGTSILRVEDTDQSRKVEGAIENLVRVMHRMGLDFDEGFYLSETGTIAERGDFGPYTQSARLGRYQEKADELVASKKAYYCFCSEQRLEELRKEQVALKQPPMYDRHCRNLRADEVTAQLAEFKSAGKRPVVRQAIPEAGSTTIHDLIYGDIAYEHRILDDQVLLKSDGFPTYHLAVVVDDHAMEITHVIRGEEWIPSTPKHLLLYAAFGWEPPRFAHLPLIVNPDKTKLSKRQGDVAVEDFLSHGYLEPALLNFVALLGWNPKTEQELFSLAELVAQFEAAKVNRSAAVFDEKKLEWINSQYIKRLTPAELSARLVPYWEASGFKPDRHSGQFLAAVAALEQERLKKLSEIGERTAYCFRAPVYETELLVWKKSDGAEAKKILTEVRDLVANAPEEDLKDRTKVEPLLTGFSESRGYGTGNVLWPLRVALTGLSASPGPFEVLAALAVGYGRGGVLERLDGAIKKLG